ncbi:MAG: hypothetical protein Q8Q73_07020 [Stagnimonas sp.]|nr:hypothetical protein [Stagnimonas sp.]
MPSLAKRYTAILLAFSTLPALAVTPTAELRLYPVGKIVSAGLSWRFDAQTEWGASVLYNRARRGDAGRHEDESGDGFGLGVELSRFWKPAPQGWFYGARAELFALDIDWRDPGRDGDSSITVIQPTLRLGYRTRPFFRSLSAAVAANAGVEINVATRGEKVGEGAIGLLSFALSYE